MHLSMPVQELNRVGKTTASRLNRLGIKRVKDLLFHFPHRYETFSELGSIADITQVNQEISVRGQIAEIISKRTRRRNFTIQEAYLADQKGSIKLIWFNQPFLVKNLKNRYIQITGTTSFQSGEMIIKSPKYQILSANDLLKEGSQTQEVESKTTNQKTNAIQPIYPLALNLTQKQVQYLIDSVIGLATILQDPIPDFVKKEQKICSLSEAILFIHKPESMNDVYKAQQRFAFEELFYLQLQTQLIRAQNNQQASPECTFFEKEIKDFLATLPFELTNDQKKSAYQIFLDMEKSAPMNRMVQGDVGSGKTLVAALAMYNTVLNGYQANIMAPTEVLASQHYKKFSQLFSHTDLPICLNTRSMKKIFHNGQEQDFKKAQIAQIIESGEVAMIIGTHALIQPDIQFKSLGLTIIDEQHRFGVKQRKLLREQSGLKNNQIPHLLSMTATPIPRSLSLVMYGDLDISSIKEMPKNRLAIKTELVTSKNRKSVYKAIHDQITQGRQAYVVCPLIDESDKLDITSVTQETQKLRELFPDLSIEMLHGKLAPAEKDALMQGFKDHEIHILVSTTVIEVGVDVPNASIMLIEAAERFGYSQLHQIRGRVGRGEYQSYCYLLPSDSKNVNTQRLREFVKCKNGFDVAELDLKTRGSGAILGTQQSGIAKFKFANINSPKEITQMSEYVQRFLQQHDLQDYPALKGHVEQLNEDVHLE